MDVTPIILGIAAVNLAVFLGGCSLAAFRTWRETDTTRRRSRARAALIAGHHTDRLSQPTHWPAR